ncbi:MAG: O-antigen ligase family protein [Limnothrix sp.]
MATFFMRDRLFFALIPALGITAFLSYAWFTLMPDNHSFMVSFPWVYLVQLGFLSGVLWAIAQLWLRRREDNKTGLQWLGGGLDWVIFCWVGTLTFSMVWSEFPQFAFMYSIINFAYIGILYGLHRYLGDRPKPLLKEPLVITQGILCWVFIVVSLVLWTKNTVLPEFARIAALKEIGIDTTYNLSAITLRNWATFGHPNYVAGFLLLALPLLGSLAIAAKSWVRWFWVSGFVLGLVAFYSTNSRGGWLGLFVALVAIAILLLKKSKLPKRWISLGSLGSLTVLIIWAVQNDRLRRTFTGLFTSGQQGGEFAYRWITAYTGWQMGWHKPITGNGLGSAFPLYQEFRPHWAGLEAEILFQLHSTPVQIWAELGLLGITTLSLGLFLLGRMWRNLLASAVWQTLDSADQVLVCGLGAASLGYGVMALTDYQLDVLAIAGFLIFNTALLTTLHHRYVTKTELMKPVFQPLTLGMASLTLLGSLLWLVPVNQAYLYAEKGFQAIRKENLEAFSANLTQAHFKTPWQPYYAYQLGWALGELSAANADNSEVQRDLSEQAILWFQQAIAASPNYEFGPNNLGWLTLPTTPTAATRYFSRAIELMPTRPMLMTGLGESWLQQDERAKGTEAIALEFVRSPAIATSPQWQEAKWQPYYADILQRTEQIFTELIDQTSPKNQTLQQWLHQNRGALRWYIGDNTAALKDFQIAQHPSGELLVALEATTPDTWQQDLSAEQISYLENNIDNNEKWALAIAAWLNPDDAESYFETTFKTTTEPQLEAIIQTLSNTLRRSTSIQNWLSIQIPERLHRSKRVGFNVTLRHLGGNQPSDFSAYHENIPAMFFFDNTFTVLRYEPEFDQALETYWQPLLDLTE